MWKTTHSSGTSAMRVLTGKKWDALVIGGGHNGLTAATYLARGGLSVAVLERRYVIGGAAVTEELIPGFKFSRCSYVQSLLRPSVIKELELERHGLKFLKRNPSSFSPCLDGRYLLLGPDKELNRSEISKFSERDADEYPRYENQLENFSKFLDPLLELPPPQPLQGVSSFNDRVKDKIRKSAFWAHCIRQALSMGQKDMLDFVNILLSPASKVLNKWFESDVLKATLATDAVIGSTGSVHTPGSGYSLLHLTMGNTQGDHGVWSYVEGGMGSVSLSISNAAKEAGAHIVTSSEDYIDPFVSETTRRHGHNVAEDFGVMGVFPPLLHTLGHLSVQTPDMKYATSWLSHATLTNIKIYIVSELMVAESGAVNGVLLADGTRVHSSVVLSNATPYKTFMELVPSNVLPDDFIRELKYSDYSSATTKINLAVDKLPQFQCCNNSHPHAGPHHRGTIHIGSESMEDIHLACQEAANGLPSRRPVIEMTIPSVLDKTISPPGKHVINLFVQYTPYKPSDGSWEEPAYREKFAQRCFSLIDEYAPGFTSSIIGYDLLTPPDLEREIGLTGGNIFHGAMGLDSLFLLRPVKGWSNYRTPLHGLYLCGSGAHPGGGVTGAPGRNAAQIVLQDLKRGLRRCA